MSVIYHVYNVVALIISIESKCANLPDDGISSHHEIAIVRIHHTCFEKF